MDKKTRAKATFLRGTAELSSARVFILAILFGLTIIFSGCLQPQEPDGVLVPPTPPEETPESKTVTVEITSEGYNPDTITINSGDTIKFVNVNDGPHRVASDPHPIHTDLRRFDSMNPLEPGDEYSFTFTEPGTWGCHDHIEPATRCTIIVQ